MLQKLAFKIYKIVSLTLNIYCIIGNSKMQNINFQGNQKTILKSNISLKNNIFEFKAEKDKNDEEETHSPPIINQFKPLLKILYYLGRFPVSIENEETEKNFANKNQNILLYEKLKFSLFSFPTIASGIYALFCASTIILFLSQRGCLPFQLFHGHIWPNASSLRSDGKGVLSGSKLLIGYQLIFSGNNYLYYIY